MVPKKLVETCTWYVAVSLPYDQPVNRQMNQEKAIACARISWRSSAFACVLNMNMNMNMNMDRRYTFYRYVGRSSREDLYER